MTYRSEQSAIGPERFICGPMRFASCYFAAIGERSEHRAFVGGIFSKLDDEQELVEWTSDALLWQQRWERVATAGLLSSLLLVALLLW